MHREALQQLDGVLVGADLRRPAFDRHRQLGDCPALPAQEQICTAGAAVAVDGDVDLVEQGAQQLFAILVEGARCCPHSVEVVAEREDRGALSVGQRGGAGGLAAGQLGFRCGELAQRLFPVALQAAGDEAVLGVDGTVAAFGLSLVAA